jgi:uncharacterized phosphosugar-binding protein
VVAFEPYLESARRALERLTRDEAGGIRAAGKAVADALERGGVIHVFGSGHSHLLAEEAFYRAGGLAPVNPILDRRLLFLDGVLESTRREREPGYAARILQHEDIREGDAAIVASNSGRNAVVVEIAIELQRRGLVLVGITSLAHSGSVAATHSSGRKLHEIADIVIDSATPPGDAAITVPGTAIRMGPLSTIVGAAIVNAIVIEAAAELVARGREPPVLPSVNLDTTSTRDLARALAPYAGRIRYLDVPSDVR